MTIIPELLDDVLTALRARNRRLTPIEAYEILVRLHALTSATIASVDPELKAFEGLPCFSGWPKPYQHVGFDTELRQLAVSDTAASGEPEPPGKRSGT